MNNIIVNSTITSIKVSLISVLITFFISITFIYFNSYKKNKKKSITYLDSYDVSGGKNKKFDILISKDYNRKKENGEVLYNFAVYQSKIYALVRLRNSSGKDSWIIEKYNCAGNYIDSLKLDKKIINLLKNERISKFEMSGKYGFIRTFSGSGVLFRVASGKTVAKIINNLRK